MCHPGVRDAVTKVLGVASPPEFGVGGAVPIITGSSLAADRSEIDLIFRGDRGAVSLIVEAKLAERDFTTKQRSVVERYAGFDSVFDSDALRQVDGEIGDYQLIRNLLAARYHHARFVLLHDERRKDLLRRLEAVLQAVRQMDLADRCRSVTWQEIAYECPLDLQEFLDVKYGIRG
jgi:hypothetical protein